MHSEQSIDLSVQQDEDLLLTQTQRSIDDKPLVNVNATNERLPSYQENVTCVGDSEYCNYTETEYLEMLHDYIFPTPGEWVLIGFHAVVFLIGLVSFVSFAFKHSLLLVWFTFESIFMFGFLSMFPPFNCLQVICGRNSSEDPLFCIVLMFCIFVWCCGFIAKQFHKMLHNTINYMNVTFDKFIFVILLRRKQFSFHSMGNSYESFVAHSATQKPNGFMTVQCFFDFESTSTTKLNFL